MAEKKVSNNPRKTGVNQGKKFAIHPSKISFSKSEAEQHIQIFSEIKVNKKGREVEKEKFSLKNHAKFQVEVVNKLIQIKEITCNWSNDGK